MVKQFNSFHGRLILPDTPDDLIVKALSLCGEWGRLEAIFLAQFFLGSVVFDVGAFIGTFGMSALKYGASKIVAVEVNRDLIPFLKKNLELNSAVPFIVENLAIGTAGLDGSCFAQRQPGNWGSLSFVGENNGETETVKLEVVESKLSSLRKNHGEYQFLKLDIEGCEFEALKGDAVWIRDNHPVIWAECNESPKSLDIMEFLMWAGYDMFYFAFPAFPEKNFNESNANIYPMAYESGLLGVPPGTKLAFPAELKINDCILQRVSSKQELKKIMWHTPRWCREGWAKMSRAELIGLVTRMSRGDKYPSFLLE